MKPNTVDDDTGHIAGLKEGRRVYTQRPLVILFGSRGIGIVGPEITNSSHTGRVHGEAASMTRDITLSGGKLGTGHVCTDRLPAKKYGWTSHLM